MSRIFKVVYFCLRVLHGFFPVIDLRQKVAKRTPLPPGVAALFVQRGRGVVNGAKGRQTARLDGRKRAHPPSGKAAVGRKPRRQAKKRRARKKPATGVNKAVWQGWRGLLAGTRWPFAPPFCKKSRISFVSLFAKEFFASPFFAFRPLTFLAKFVTMKIAPFFLPKNVHRIPRRENCFTFFVISRRSYQYVAFCDL